MRFARARVWLGSWSALLALAIQFALSFGHLHFDRSGLVPLALRSVIQAPAAGLSAAPMPGPHKPAGLAGDFCAVGSAIPSNAPTLPLRATFSRVSPEARAEVAPATSPHLFFQQRAPPQV